MIETICGPLQSYLSIFHCKPSRLDKEMNYTDLCVLCTHLFIHECVVAALIVVTVLPVANSLSYRNVKLFEYDHCHTKSDFILFLS